MIIFNSANYSPYDLSRLLPKPQSSIIQLLSTSQLIQLFTNQGDNQYHQYNQDKMLNYPKIMRIPHPTLFLTPKCTFSYKQINKQDSKAEAVGFKKNIVHNFNKIAYEPQQQMKSVNGKYLLYQYKQSYLQKLLRSSLFTVPLIGFAYMIYSNPFADTFPAAKPIFVMLELLIMKFWISNIKRKQNIIKQIYLYEDGGITQIWYNNQFKRKMMGEPLSRTYYNSIFTNPDLEKQSEESFVIDHQNTRFPSSDDYDQVLKPNIEKNQINTAGFSWIKYFSNGENYFMIPKNPEYINLEVLTRVFEGKIIITNRLSKKSD